MEKAKLMQLEIEKQRKLPKEVKNNINTVIFQNLIAATIIMAYFCIINITYYNTETVRFEEYMKYFALGIILITVIDIEIAYRKNSIKLWIIGIEFLISGVVSLYIPYIYLHTNNIIRIIVMILPAILVIYYLLKSLIIYKQKKFHYQNNLSDVKEIMKDDEKKSYLEEESKKKYREKTEEEEEIKQVILKEQAIRRKKRQIDAEKQSINKNSRINIKENAKKNTNNKLDTNTKGKRSK